VRFLLVWVSLAALGCQPRAEAQSAQPAAPPARSEVPMIVTVDEALPTEELLERAERRLEKGELELAQKDFEILLQARQKPDVEARVRLGYARVLEGRGRLTEAAEQLELRLSLVGPDEVDSARIELIRRLLLLERFADAWTVGRSVERARLSTGDRIVLQASEGLALVAEGDPDRAEAALAPAWAALEAAGEAGERRLAAAAALVEFASGDISAVRARRILFDPVPDDVRSILEARCRHLVTAQSAYGDAMRLERGALRLLAGERIARLYVELHRDILAAPLPPGSGQADIAEGALLLRYDVLLQKAEQMLRITLEGTATSEATQAFRRSVEVELERLLAQRAAYAQKLEGLSISKDDLGRVLDSLGPPLDSNAP
jgi:tetratricopeptide (TPR) repeat protein